MKRQELKRPSTPTCTPCCVSCLRRLGRMTNSHHDGSSMAGSCQVLFSLEHLAYSWYTRSIQYLQMIDEWMGRWVGGWVDGMNEYKFSGQRLQSGHLETSWRHTRAHWSIGGSDSAEQALSKPGHSVAVGKPLCSPGRNAASLTGRGLPAQLVITHFPTSWSQTGEPVLSAIKKKMEHHKSVSSLASLHLGTGRGSGKAWPVCGP